MEFHFRSEHVCGRNVRLMIHRTGATATSNRIEALEESDHDILGLGNGQLLYAAVRTSAYGESRCGQLTPNALPPAFTEW